MEQRQLRLGDILDDYCPRERRITNHAIVALVGPDVKQVRCATCDAEHEFKHAKVPRPRRKANTPAALYAQVAAGAPKRVAHDPETDNGGSDRAASEAERARVAASPAPAARELAASADAGATEDEERVADNPKPVDDGASDEGREEEEEGPVHRPLIRASLPRPEGQPSPSRPLPEFTIRQPGGRQNRFRPRHQQHQRGGHGFQGDGSGGNMGGGPMRSGSGARQGGRPAHGGTSSRFARRDGPGRKRSK